MRTLLLVGLGGAIGSMLRAWLGSVMVSLTGSAFPWGTILINVVGSAVIGFVATMTASDGRFPAALDLRAFVMVGICGGFTTFSSFSLQTLELLRDARAGQAAANVALSVLLCLGSVACGSRAALQLRLSAPARLGALSPGALSHHTLVALCSPERAPAMLALAGRLTTPPRQVARLPGIEEAAEIDEIAPQGGHVTALLIDDPAGRGRSPPPRRPDADNATMLPAMREALDTWASTERDAGRGGRWIETRGDGSRAIVEHARGVHLVLLEQGGADPGAGARIRAVLGQARRKLLLVAPDAPRGIGRAIAVAWRDDPASHAALRAAAPLLARAAQVVVVGIAGGSRPVGDEAPRLPDDLARALAGGPAIEHRTLSVEPDRIEPRLLALATDAGADLLVLGAVGSAVDAAMLSGDTTAASRMSLLVLPA